jgi:hypothetical protein
VTHGTVEHAGGAIRNAIDGDPANSRFIETVKRRGSRFIGAVNPVGVPPTQDAFEEWRKGRLSLEAYHRRAAAGRNHRFRACRREEPPVRTGARGGSDAYATKNAIFGLLSGRFLNKPPPMGVGRCQSVTARSWCHKPQKIFESIPQLDAGGRVYGTVERTVADRKRPHKAVAEPLAPLSRSTSRANSVRTEFASHDGRPKCARGRS